MYKAKKIPPGRVITWPIPTFPPPSGPFTTCALLSLLALYALIRETFPAWYSSPTLYPLLPFPLLLINLLFLTPSPLSIPFLILYHYPS